MRTVEMDGERSIRAGDLMQIQEAVAGGKIFKQEQQIGSSAMLSPNQREMSRSVLKKLGVLAIPNQLEKSFSIYNCAYDDPISERVKHQVSIKNQIDHNAKNETMRKTFIKEMNQNPTL